MKGFQLNDDELWDMLNIFKDDLEEYIGEFDGEIIIDMGMYAIGVILDDNKYVCNEAVVRKLESFFITSQFNRDEFIINDELKYYIDIRYNVNI